MGNRPNTDRGDVTVHRLRWGLDMLGAIFAAMIGVVAWWAYTNSTRYAGRRDADEAGAALWEGPL